MSVEATHRIDDGRPRIVARAAGPDLVGEMVAVPVGDPGKRERRAALAHDAREGPGQGASAGDVEIREAPGEANPAIAARLHPISRLGKILDIARDEQCSRLKGTRESKRHRNARLLSERERARDRDRLGRAQLDPVCADAQIKI